MIDLIEKYIYINSDNHIKEIVCKHIFSEIENIIGLHRNNLIRYSTDFDSLQIYPVKNLHDILLYKLQNSWAVYGNITEDELYNYYYKNIKDKVFSTPKINTNNNSIYAEYEYIKYKIEIIRVHIDTVPGFKERKIINQVDYKTICVERVRRV